MEILIDATSIVGKPTGAGNYALKLLENLSKIDKKNNYKVIVQKKLSPDHPVFNLRFQFLKADLPTVGLKRQLFYPFFFKKNKISCDIFHCLTPYLPLGQNFPSIITVHDLTYIKYPSFLKNKLKSFYLKKITELACQKAVEIIAVSKSTKKDLYQILKVPLQKTRVIYEDSFLEKPKIPPKFLPKLRKPYILCVAEKRPHKNLEGLIRAFYFFKKIDKWKTSLVLVGESYRRYKDFLSLIEKLGLKESVLLMEKISNEDLASLYWYADLFLLLSFSEGFGLPVLEAMRFGLPVVISNISALTEIAGDSAAAVDPRAPKEIAETIFKIFSSEDYRNTLIEKGMERVKNFSWEETAKETLKTYEEVYERAKDINLR